MKQILIESEFDGVKNFITEELNESTNNVEKKYYISGTYTIAEQFNRNRRYYPMNICENAINRYRKEFVDTITAYGEIMHPTYLTPDISKSAIMVVKYQLIPGSKIYEGKAKVLSTPSGEIIKSLIKDGCRFGVSTRGEGQVESMNEGGSRVLDWEIMAVDVVGTPSVSEAMVNHLYESKLNHYYTKEQLNEYKTTGDQIITSTFDKTQQNKEFKKLVDEMFAQIRKNPI